MKPILHISALLCSFLLAPSAMAQTYAGTLDGKTKMKTYPIKMSADRIYRIEMNSAVFDTFLRVLDPDGKQAAKNDDIDAQNRNSRIVFRPEQAGEYRVVATSFQQEGTGLYVLNIDTFKAKGEVRKLSGKIDDDSPLFEKEIPFQSHKMKMEAGTSYLIEADSAKFVPVVAVRQPGGRLLESVNLTGEAKEARMIFSPTRTGDYEILTAPFQRDGRGAFTMRVQEVAAEKEQ